MSTGTQPTLLIINADDFGLTEGVCRAILRAHEDGVVTSTSALAIAPAFRRCAGWLADAPDLGIGVHLAAVGEDPPLLSAHEIPTLVDERGRLPRSWRQLLPKVALHRVDPADLEREFAAQGDLVRATLGPGRITHLDTHQHVHLWPDIGSIVCELAQRWGIPAVRGTQAARRSAIGLAVNRLGRGLGRKISEAGLQSPEAFRGLDDAGAVSTARLVDMIDGLAASRAASAEVGVHPGEADDPDLARYAWGYRWGEELAALLAPDTRRAVERAGFVLGTFGDLPRVVT